MKIRIIFFAATADRAKTRATQVEMPVGATIAHLGQRVVDEYPPLQDLRLVYALNEQYVSANQLLNDGDDVAVFTPVSGG